jgi:hypothetical protein
MACKPNKSMSKAMGSSSKKTGSKKAGSSKKK